MRAPLHIGLRRIRVSANFALSMFVAVTPWLIVHAPARAIDLWYQALQHFRRHSVESVVGPPPVRLRNKIGHILKAIDMRQSLAATVRELAGLRVVVLGVTPIAGATGGSATASSMVIRLAILWACMVAGIAAALLAFFWFRLWLWLWLSLLGLTRTAPVLVFL